MLLVGWQSLGNLTNGGNAGVFYVNGNNGLGNTRWNIGSRLSGQWHIFRHDYRTHLWMRCGSPRSTQ